MDAALRFRICKKAADLFQQHGFEAVSMVDIAQQTGVAEEELYLHFGNKKDLVLFIYHRINSDWQLSIETISSQKLADRFEEALKQKLRMMEPYKGFLGQMMGWFLHDEQIGIQAPRTAHIRAMGMKSIHLLIEGASDTKRLQQKVPGLPAILYLMHWGILFLYLKPGREEQWQATLDMLCSLLKKASKTHIQIALFPLLKGLVGWSNTMLDESETQVEEVDRAILRILFNHRKVYANENGCDQNPCDTCYQLHEQDVFYFTRQNLPLEFVLPAFPAKSPNREKTLGILPDLGEEIALKNLDDLCREIQSVYPPGAHITICSDGRIFSELVGVTDAEVTMYVNRIRELITELNCTQIRILNLEDLLPAATFSEQKQQVLKAYAEDLEQLKKAVKNNAEFRQLFNGMHRFITEDQLVRHPELSKSKVRTASKEIALKVIQHSNAWTRFLAHVFPESLRLSIHPYTPHHTKMGVRLTKANNNWITPWHGVIVLKENDYVLMKRKEAEEQGAKLVFKDELPHHFTLTQS